MDTVCTPNRNILTARGYFQLNKTFGTLTPRRDVLRRDYKKAVKELDDIETATLSEIVKLTEMFK